MSRVLIEGKKPSRGDVAIRLTVSYSAPYTLLRLTVVLIQVQNSSTVGENKYDRLKRCRVILAIFLQTSGDL